MVWEGSGPDGLAPIPISFVLIYSSQGDFGQYIGAVLRNFPLLTVVFCLIRLSYRLRFTKRTPAATLRQPGQQLTLYRQSGI